VKVCKAYQTTLLNKQKSLTTSYQENLNLINDYEDVDAREMENRRTVTKRQEKTESSLQVSIFKMQMIVN